ncbi:MAG TPA: methylenetetrahydrofolate reductase [NAD(P)H] [Abditibacteriaceae bacterium]|jgi:methylenetetrahydrofolate reductase (NADPH)
MSTSDKPTFENPRIDALFPSGQPLISFEFFPPKDEKGAEQLYHTIEELKPLRPSFVSITRTGGGTPPTLDLTARVQNEIGIRGMAHMTCVGHTASEMNEYLDRLWDSGVRNVLALRGDLPPGQTALPADADFAYASDLVRFVRERHNFCIGVAGYPEGHPQALNFIRDTEHLKRKIDAGAQFIITQLFFDNADFYRWRDQVHGMGIDVPLVAGIMPILSTPQIKRFVTMCGAKIPHPLLLRLESLESDPLAVHAAGVEYAIRQCEDLLANGVHGLHFYTLNRSKATVLISQALNLKDHPS